MAFLRTKIGVSVLMLVVATLFGFATISGVFGNTQIGLTLRSNASLERGLVAHYTFDGAYESGTFDFGTEGVTTTDPSTSLDRIYDATFDSSGYFYVTGYCTGCGSFGSEAHYTYKVDPQSGDMIWATTTDPTNALDLAFGITTDHEDQVYVTGYCNGCGSQGDRGTYTYKIDSSNGEMLWATTTDLSSSFDAGVELVVDDAGYLFLLSYCLDCGNTGSGAFYTMKIDTSDQSIVWATTTDPSTSNDEPTTIVKDDFGNLYIAGYCACGSYGGLAHYLLKMDPMDGSMLWATTTDPSSGSDIVGDIIVDDDGYIYFTGNCDDCDPEALSSHYTYKVDPSDGSMLWATSTNPSTTSNTGYGIALDSEGGVYVTGSCLGCGPQGSFAVYSYKVDPSDGSMLWASTTDFSNGLDSTFGHFIDKNDHLYTTIYADDEACNAAGTSECHVITKSSIVDGSLIDTSSTGAVRSVGADVTQGNIGQGVTFDGIDDYVRVVGGDGSVFDTTTSDFSVAGWFKTSSSTESLLLTATSSTVDAYEVRMLSSGTLRFRYSPGGGDTQTYETTETYNDGKWHHFVGVRNDVRTGQLYIDGELIVDDTDNTGSLSGIDITSDFYIGSGSNYDYQFDGELDDIRLYDRELSSAEAKRLYQLGATTKINKTLTTNPDLENGLVGHWTFDGEYTDLSTSTGEVLDRSGNDNTANWANHASTTILGKLGQAIEFDGTDDYVAVNTDDASLKPTTNVSYGGWVYKHADAIQVIMEKGGGTAGYALYGDTDGKFCLVVDGATSGNQSMASTNTFELNKWHHVFATFDDSASTKSRIYVNGVEETPVASANCSLVGNLVGGIDHNTTPIAFGTRGGTTLMFDGVMDDLRVYDRTLFDEEILRLYQLGATTKINTTITTNSDLERGLVGHWTFDGKHMDVSSTTAEAEDRSSEGNDGDWRDHATTTTFGKIGQAIDLDGTDDRVLVANEEDYDFTSDFSVGLWVKSTDFGYVAMVGKYQASQGWDLGISSGEPRMAIRGASQIDTAALATKRIDDGKWHHVFAVNTPTSIRLYIDGEFDVEVAGTWTATTNDTRVHIGNRRGESGTYMEGLVDDVRIYNRALSDEEVKRIYELGG